MARTTSNTVTRGELLDVAADVAWRFNAYGSYGTNRATAIRAIRRKCTGFSPRQLENAFEKSLALYDFAQQLVREHAAKLWAATKSGDKNWSRLLDNVLRSRFPAYRISTLRNMVAMTFYYWHMR